MRAILKLPFPPSANKIWRNARGRTYLSKEYKTFVEYVVAEWRANVVDNWETDARYAVCIQLFAPTRRKFDVDNRIKPTLDALTKAGAWLDDEQVDDVRAVKFFPSKSSTLRGVAMVTIESY